MKLAETIAEKLRAAFNPDVLKVINESHHHAGHAGDNGTGESHFRVIIVSNAFAGMSKVARQREVYRILQAEISQQIHALSMETHTSDEYGVAKCENNF